MLKSNKTGRVIRAIWTFVAPLLSPQVMLILLGVIASLATAAGEWGKKTTPISNWVICLGCVLAIAAIVYVITAIVAARKRAKQQPLSVTDTTCGLRWRIHYPVASWVNAQLDRYGSQAIDDIISGPYHAINDCNALIYGESPTPIGDMQILNRCPVCQLPITITDEIVVWVARYYRASQYAGPYSTNSFKKAVLKELIRLHQSGKNIREGMQIELGPKQL